MNAKDKFMRIWRAVKSIEIYDIHGYAGKWIKIAERWEHVVVRSDYGLEFRVNLPIRSYKG